MTLRQDIRTVQRIARAAGYGKRPQRRSRSQQTSVFDSVLGAAQKYAKTNAPMREILRDKTRLSKFLATVARIFGGATIGPREIDAAIRILMAAGYEKPSRRRREKPGVSPPGPTPPPFFSAGTPMGRDDIVTAEFADDIVTAEFADDPVMATIVGDREPVGPKEASRTRQAAARVHLVDSTNVHSFYYVRTGKVGTLYVTFLKWRPGMKKGARTGPGPTYAYYEVGVQKYLHFKAASRASAGAAVWDYLRVRGEGNQARHQHQYGLTRVGHLGERALDEYVPRKITTTGYRTRNLPDLSGRSTLWPKTFKTPLNRARKVTRDDGSTVYR